MMHEKDEKFNKEINSKPSKKTTEKFKNVITELKNSIESFRSRVDYVKESATWEIRQWKLHRGAKRKKNENSLWELWINMKRKNICIMGIPEREEKKEGT